MYEFYNPHPQQKTVGDCVKRALTKASGKTYQEVSNELNRIKRAQGASAYNSNSVWTEYVEKNLGGVKVSYPAEKGKPRMNGERFCEEHPNGTYVLRMAGHLACCVDGVIYDTWNCLDKCVYGSYEIKHEAVDTHHEIVRGKVASAGPKTKSLKGDEVIKEFAEMVGVKVKVTRKGEPWISLSHENYAVVLEKLLHSTEYRHLRWETKRGARKTTIRDEHSGMVLILKNGDSAYLWCTEIGR